MQEAGAAGLRLTASGAALLACSVLADSAIEHYRGSFHNPAMVAPLAASSVNIAMGVVQAAGGRLPRPVCLGGGGAAIAVGAAGLGFHAFNILRRPGAISFSNLFYGAPVGAPAALILSGSLAIMASAPSGAILRDPGQGRAIASVAALGLGGTVAEAGLLHFRGAYHNPAMWLPIILPPLGALSLAWDTVKGYGSRRSIRLLLGTALLGLIGSGFHALGVARNMGGWRNWRQNLLAGPPLPAPPSFTGLAIAGLGALKMMGRRSNG